MAKKNVEGVQSVIESCLSKTKVTVKYVERVTDLIKDPNHIAYGGLLDTAFIDMVVKKTRNGRYPQILTDDERVFLEGILNYKENTLSQHNQEYWDTKKVRLMRDGLTLDLSDPEDYINYRLLLTCTDVVAPSMEAVGNKKSYRFVIIHEGERIDKAEKVATDKQECWMLIGKYRKKKDEMHYALSKLSHKVMHKDSSEKELFTLLTGTIDKDPEMFRKVFEDRYFKTKCLIFTAVRYGVITRKGDEYFDQDGKSVCGTREVSTLEKVCVFLNEPENQEVKFTIEARIKNARE